MRRLIWPLVRFLIELQLYQITQRQPWHRRVAQQIVRDVCFLKPRQAESQQHSVEQSASAPLSAPMLEDLGSPRQQ
jgi:hypothetical protein